MGRDLSTSLYPDRSAQRAPPIPSVPFTQSTPCDRRFRPCRKGRYSSFPLASMFSFFFLTSLHHHLLTSLLCFKSFSCNTYGPPRKCCKQKTYVPAKPFRCNTYKKQGGTSFKPNTFLCPRPVTRHPSLTTSLKSFPFTLLRTLLHNGHRASAFHSITCALFSPRRRVHPPLLHSGTRHLHSRQTQLYLFSCDSALFAKNAVRASRMLPRDTGGFLLTSRGTGPATAQRFNRQSFLLSRITDHKSQTLLALSSLSTFNCRLSTSSAPFFHESQLTDHESQFFISSILWVAL